MRRANPVFCLFSWGRSSLRPWAVFRTAPTPTAPIALFSSSRRRRQPPSTPAPPSSLDTDLDSFSSISPPSSSTSSRVAVQVAMNQARAQLKHLMQNRNFQKMTEKAQQLLTFLSQNNAKEELVAEAYIALGEASKANNKLELARSSFDSAFTILKNLNSMTEQAKLERFQSLAQQGWTVTDNNALMFQAMLGLGQTKVLSGDLAGAEELLKECVAASYARIAQLTHLVENRHRQPFSPFEDMREHEGGNVSEHLKMADEYLTLLQANAAQVSFLLATLYANLGKFKEAEEMFQKSMNTEQDEKHALEVVERLLGYADFKCYKHEVAEARTLVNQAITILTDCKKLSDAGEILGGGEPYAIMVMVLTARVHLAELNFKEARTQLKRASQLATLHKLALPFGLSLCYLGAAHRALDESAQAQRCLKHGLAVLKELFGPTHPSLGYHVHNYCLVLDHAGKTSEADGLLRQALATNHGPQRAYLLFAAGRVAESQEQPGVAVSMYLDSAKLFKQVYGDKHPDLAHTCASLGRVYMQKGEVAHAAAMFHRAVTIFTEAFGEYSPLAAESLCGLAEACYEDGRMKEAEEYYLEALEALEKLSLGDTPRFAHLLRDLSTLYERKGESDLAQEYSTRAVALFHKLGISPFTDN